MKRSSPPAELSTSDSTGAAGMVIPRDGAFEAHSGRAGYLGKYPSAKAAAQAIAKGDRETGSIMDGTPNAARY